MKWERHSLYQVALNRLRQECTKREGELTISSAVLALQRTSLPGHGLTAEETLEVLRGWSYILLIRGKVKVT